MHRVSKARIWPIQKKHTLHVHGFKLIKRHCNIEPLPGLLTAGLSKTHKAHDVVATLNQRQ